MDAIVNKKLKVDGGGGSRFRTRIRVCRSRKDGADLLVGAHVAFGIWVWGKRGGGMQNKGGGGMPPLFGWWGILYKALY